MNHYIIRSGTISRWCIVRYGCPCDHVAYMVPIHWKGTEILLFSFWHRIFLNIKMKCVHHPGHIHRTPGDNWPMLRL